MFLDTLLFHGGSPKRINLAEGFAFFPKGAADGGAVNFVKRNTGGDFRPDGGRGKTNGMTSHFDFGQHVAVALRNEDVADVIGADADGNFLFHQVKQTGDGVVGGGGNGSELAHGDSGGGAADNAEVVFQKTVQQAGEFFFRIGGRRNHVNDPDAGTGRIIKLRSINPTQAFNQGGGAALARVVSLVKMNVNFFFEFGAEADDAAKVLAEADFAVTVSRRGEVILFRQGGDEVAKLSGGDKCFPAAGALLEAEDGHGSDTDFYFTSEFHFKFKGGVDGEESVCGQIGGGINTGVNGGSAIGNKAFYNFSHPVFQMRHLVRRSAVQVASEILLYRKRGITSFDGSGVDVG